MYGTCNCYSCTAIVCNVFGTIYALLRCDTAVSRKVLQVISMKAYATVPKGIIDSGLYSVLNKSRSNVMAERVFERLSTL